MLSAPPLDADVLADFLGRPRFVPLFELAFAFFEARDFVELAGDFFVLLRVDDVAAFLVAVFLEEAFGLALLPDEAFDFAPALDLRVPAFLVVDFFVADDLLAEELLRVELFRELLFFALVLVADFVPVDFFLPADFAEDFFAVPFAELDFLRVLVAVVFFLPLDFLAPVVLDFFLVPVLARLPVAFFGLAFLLPVLLARFFLVFAARLAESLRRSSFSPSERLLSPSPSAPPVCLFTVAQALFSASSSLTPLSS